MNTPKILLVHGAWHNASCWDLLVPIFREEGIEVAAADYSQVLDKKRVGWRVTLEDYAEVVNTAAEKMGPGVNIVGHSFGGIVVNRAVSENPEIYQSITYLSAFLVGARESMLSVSNGFDSNQVAHAIKTNWLRGVSSVEPNKAGPIFYQNAAEEVIKKFSKVLCQQPLRPLIQKVDTNPEILGKVPKHYIFCDEDKAICISEQIKMEARNKCHKTTRLNSDHSPFLSTPHKLAAAITQFPKH